jgi:hypothetical protein
MTLAADHSVAIFGGYRMVVAAAHYDYASPDVGINDASRFRLILFVWMA